MAAHEHARGEPLVAECEGHAGAASVVAATLDPQCRTLVF
jgi:hypothetical protein